MNPTSHYVYQGWMYFFSTYYDFTMFDEAYTTVSAGKHIKIGYSHGFFFMNSGFNFIDNKKKILDTVRGGVLITGDLTTHDFAWRCLFRRNTIFFTELFALSTDNWRRRVLFFLYLLPFRGKPFLVSSLKAQRTLKRYTRKVFYLPPLYHGKTALSRRLGDSQLRITVVGYVDDWKKNHRLLFEALNELHDEGVKLHLDVVGGFRGADRSMLQMIRFPHTVHGQIDHEKVKEVYKNANVHVQPSLIDPVGYAAIEAMAHGLPVVVSANCGCTDFVNDNGVIFEPTDKEAFKRALRSYASPRKRILAGKKSKSIIEKHYWTGNKRLLEQQHARFERFVAVTCIAEQ